MGPKNSKLKPQVMSDLVENTEFTKDEIKLWYHGFKEDYPQGYITLNNFKDIYNSFYPEGDAATFAEHTFRIFDSNKDGRIDFREFITGLSVSSRGSFEEKLSWIFELYDTNSNGFISRDEMFVIVKSIMVMTVDTTKVPESDAVAHAEKRVDQIYQKMDKNADGLLSLEEFIELGKNDPTLCNVLNGDMAQY